MKGWISVCCGFAGCELGCRSVEVDVATVVSASRAAEKDGRRLAQAGMVQEQAGEFAAGVAADAQRRRCAGAVAGL